MPSKSVNLPTDQLVFVEDTCGDSFSQRVQELIRKGKQHEEDCES